ncbi:MAG: zf-HC2 domain-containing protein [Solirubrobacterales bacterium]|nr:zf-HC2 domain-containing protein [Solirubrobacterales bacterium]
MSTSDRPHGESPVTGMLARVLGPVGPEVTCERCFELLDQYVDREVAGGDADAEFPGMREHLEGCPACHEDHESLRDLVAGTSGDARVAGDGDPR